MPDPIPKPDFDDVVNRLREEAAGDELASREQDSTLDPRQDGPEILEPYPYVVPQEIVSSGYMPQNLLSDMGLKEGRELSLTDPDLYQNTKGYVYNQSLSSAWNWQDQLHPDNLDLEGNPYNQYGESLPFGAVYWSPFGLPEYSKEGAYTFEGVWKKYMSTLNAPYGQNVGEGSRYRAQPPPLPDEDEVQKMLESGLINKGQAVELKLESERIQNQITDKIKEELTRTTGEDPDILTKQGRVPEAIFKALFEASVTFSYELERELNVINDIVATAQKQLGIPLAYELYDPEARPEWVKRFSEKIDPEGYYASYEEQRAKEQEEVYEEYFKEAPMTVSNLFIESFVDYNLFKAYSRNGLVEGGPIWESLNTGRILYTGIKDPLIRAEYIQRMRDGEDPYLLSLELEDSWAEAMGRSVIDPLIPTGIATKRMRDGWRLTNYAKKVLGQTKGFDKASDAINAIKKGQFYPDAARIYETAAINLGKDSADALIRFEKFGHKSGVAYRTAAAKQYFMNRVSSEVWGNIIRATPDPQIRADGMRAIVLMASDKIDDIKTGLILASEFPVPKLLHSDAARMTGFVWRETMKNVDGVVDATRFMKDLTKAQSVGPEALNTFLGGKLDKGIGKLYKPIVDRMADTALAQKAFGNAYEKIAIAAKKTGTSLTKAQITEEANKLLTAAQKTAMADELPKHIQAAAKFDASKLGQWKRSVNNFFASIYMGYNPGWFSRNIQNNVLTTVVDQGIESMRFWHIDGAKDTIGGWVGKMNVEGFGPKTKMGVADYTDIEGTVLPDDVQQVMGYADDIQTKLDELFEGIAPGKVDMDEVRDLNNQLSAVDMEIAERLDKHSITDLVSPQGKQAPGFYWGDKAEQWSGYQVVATVVEREMLRALKPGRALPDLGVLIEAGWTQDAAEHLVSLVVMNQGDIHTASRAFTNILGEGESVFVLASRAWMPDDMAKMLTKYKWTQQYDDIVVGGIIRGEPRDVVIKKWRAATIDGLDEMAAKVSDDIVTLAGDVEDVELFRSAAFDAVEDGIMDEDGVATFYTYIGLNENSTTSVSTALEMFKDSATKTGDAVAVKRAEDLIASMREAGAAVAVEREIRKKAVLGSRGRKMVTQEDFLKEWNKLGLEGSPPADMTLKEFTDIRWREHFFIPTRAEHAAVRDVVYKEFQALLEEFPNMVVDPHFLDAVNTSYMSAVSFDPIMRADEVRIPLSTARYNKDWDKFTRILANQYGIPTTTYEAGRAIPNDVGVLNIINENLGTEYVRYADIPEAHLNEAFRRHITKEYALKIGQDIPDFAPLGKAAEEAAQPYLSGLTKWTPEEYADELEKWKVADKNIEVEVFGEEGAKRYKKALRDDFMDTHEDTLADIKIVNEMEDSLTPEQLNILHGIGGETSYDELLSYKDAFEVAGMEDDLLYQVMKSRITKIDPKVTEMSPDLLFMQRATRELEKRGKNIDEIMDNVGARLVSEIGEEDAMFILKGLRQAPEAAPSRPFLPPIGDNTPLMPRMAAETRDGAADLINRIETGIHENWGKVLPDMEGETTKMLEALKIWTEEGFTKIEEARAISRMAGYAARDFTLHSYPDKRGIDVALSYIYPYEFWHTRTYAKWMQRALTDPAVVATYSRYLGTLEKIHSDSPEWWKYNINTDELLGIDTGNPFFINPQSSLDPLYGMTGVDFNDPQKRVNWYSTALDNVSKWGPAPHTFSNYLVAGALLVEGAVKDDERLTEAGKRWAGRLIPQTKPIKALASLLGINLKTYKGINEIDPAILAFNQGITPYEKDLVVKELSGMVDNEEISEVQMMDAYLVAEGEHWDTAHERAIRRRAPADMSSFMLGMRWRGRNVTDQKTEDAYRDMFRLLGQKETLSPDEYSDGWKEVFKGREWMQGLLIGRKHGFARDEALTYNVLSRVSPGGPRGLADLVENVPGMPPYPMFQEFYETNGDVLYEWSDVDRGRFMDGIMAMQSIIDLPPDATKEMHQAAKDANQRMRSTMEFLHGENIHELISGFHAIKAEGDFNEWEQPRIWDAQQDYLNAYPQVETAMDTMSAMKGQNPDAAPYYSSIEGMERYYNSWVWDTVAKKYPGVFDEWKDYHGKMDVWDGTIAQFEQDSASKSEGHVLYIKERRDAMAIAADDDIVVFEMLHPAALEIDDAYTQMWEDRGWAIYKETGTTGDTGKLWAGYYAIPAPNKAERRAYYKEHEAAFDIGKDIISEHEANIRENYTDEEIGFYEEWKTITDARWDMYNYGYIDVLRGEGVERWQFDDYEEYNNLITQKYEERDAIFDASEALSEYTETLHAYQLKAAEEMVKTQEYLPVGPGTVLRDAEGVEISDLAQQLQDYISAKATPYTGFYGYTWDDWKEQVDEPIMNLIEDYVVDGYDVPEELFDSLERISDRIGIMSPELLFEMIQSSYR